MNLSMVETFLWAFPWDLESLHAILCYLPFSTGDCLLNCCTFSTFLKKWQDKNVSSWSGSNADKLCIKAWPATSCRNGMSCSVNLLLSLLAYCSLASIPQTNCAVLFLVCSNDTLGSNWNVNCNFSLSPMHARSYASIVHMQDYFNHCISLWNGSLFKEIRPLFRNEGPSYRTLILDIRCTSKCACTKAICTLL